MSKVIGVAIVVFGLIASSCVFVVEQWQLAVKFRLGEIVRTDYEPGLHFKLPFINNIRKFDGRVLTLDAEAERYLTREKKNVIVDSYVKWRIADVAKFYTALSGDESLALSRLSQVVKNGLRDEFGKRTIQEVISGERQTIMASITKLSNIAAEDLGLSVVDVRIKRIDLPNEVSESVYDRMVAERSRVAKDLRSKGAEAAMRITADADRQRTIILAEAYRDAERIRGEGDAKSAEIYANSYKKDAEFYSFYRSLTAYENTFKSNQDILVIQPDSEFFKYFNDSKGSK